MARKPRIEYEGAFYHIVVRGNQKQNIFKDKADYSNYLDILSDYKKRHQFLLYSYMLMSNHIHLLIETGKFPLSKILQGINQSYTMYFNRKYKTVGHLFQGRYKSILCDRDAYLISLMKYIHLNPVRARMVKSPEEYQWSSHNCYAKKKEKNELIDTDQVLRMFSEDKTIARKYYRSFMGYNTAIKKDDVYSTVDQRILGGEQFVEKVMDIYDGELTKTRINKEYRLFEIAKEIEKIHGITLKQIRQKSKSRKISLGRKLVTLVANEYSYKGNEIAEYTKRDPSAITRHLKEKRKLKKETGRVIDSLTKNKSNSNKQV